MNNPAMSRRRAREIAFQFLYGNLMNTPVTFSRSEYEHFCRSFGFVPDEFTWELIEGTGTNLAELDKYISQLSVHWRIERMPRVDLSLLRLASYEILYRPDIPKTVSINEAVELAKRFGAEDSAAFINGILDKITKP